MRRVRPDANAHTHCDPLPTPTASPTPSPSATRTPTPAPTVVTFDLDITADEAEYVEQLRSIDNLMGDLLGSIGEALNVTWPTRERLLSPNPPKDGLGDSP